MARNAFIPYGSGWSTPFAKWQGSLAGEHPLKLAAKSAGAALLRAGIEPAVLEGLVLGWTIPSPQAFYGAPWLAGLIGAQGITGPMISQACATSARCLQTAAQAVVAGEADVLLVLAADRCSNGPHLVWGDPRGPGGRPKAEDWVWDNFGCDPFAGTSMVETAENVAREAGIGREAQDEITLLRYEQYQQALAEERAFQKRYMIPAELGSKSRGKPKTLVEDEGVFPTTAEGLQKLKPVLKEGSVTFGTQTYPADGNAGLVVASEDRARELSRDPAISIQLCGFGSARVKPSFMAMAVVPAAEQALAAAGFDARECTIKTHNPFAVNDVYMAKELDLPPESFNNFGSSLIYGHPQGPTGLRLVVELIEELVLKGGGRGLFAGCAAGDSALAVALEVNCR